MAPSYKQRSNLQRPRPFHILPHAESFSFLLQVEELLETQVNRFNQRRKSDGAEAVSGSVLARISTGHPKNYLFSLSKKYIFWIKVFKKIYNLILKLEALEAEHFCGRGSICFKNISLLLNYSLVCKQK